MIEEWQVIKSLEEYEEAKAKMLGLLHGDSVWAGEPPDRYPCMAYGMSTHDNCWDFVYFYEEDAAPLFSQEPVP